MCIRSALLDSQQRGTGGEGYGPRRIEGDRGGITLGGGMEIGAVEGALPLERRARWEARRGMGEGKVARSRRYDVTRESS